MDGLTYFFIFLVEAYILYEYACRIFVPKYSLKKTFLSIFLGYLFLFAVSFIKNATVNTIAFFLVSLLLLYLLFSIRISHAIFHIAILTSIMVLSELLTAAILANYTPNLWTEWSHASSFLLFVVICKLIYFFSTQLLARLLTGKHQNTSSTDAGTFLLVIISACSVMIPLFLSGLGRNLPHSPILEYTIAGGSALMFIILLLVYVLYGYNQKKSGEFTDLQLRLQKEKDASEYYHMLVAQDEKQKIMIHDIKKHLQSLTLLLKDGKQEEAEHYLENLLHSDSLRSSIRVCDHDLLNAILCRYQRQCETRGISFHADIRNGCAGMLTEEEITAVFCNLLDNAMEAIGETAEGWIEVRMWNAPKQSVTTLVVNNSCPIPPTKGSLGQFLTTKANSISHGYGLRSVKQIASNHEGHTQAYYDEKNGSFHVIVNFFNVSQTNNHK